MFQSLSDPLVRSGVVSLLLHVTVIGCLLLTLRLPSEGPKALQVVLVDLPDGRAGTGPAGGGGSGNGNFIPAEARSGIDTPTRVPSGASRAFTEPSMKPREESSRPNVTENRPVQTKEALPSPSPLARAVPTWPLQRKPSSSSSEQSAVSSGAVPDEDFEKVSRPEGNGEDSTRAEALTSLGGEAREGSSAPAEYDRGLYNSLVFQGGSGGGRGGGHGVGIGTGTGPGAGLGSGGGTDWRLLILERIHRVKRYPARARRWGMEGTAEVQFRIARDGSVEDVTLVKSSGFPILDRATVETLKRAAPLPVIPGTIRIPISYRLHER